jgi:hypothetical protein
MKIDEKKDHHSLYHLGKMYDYMILFKTASITQLKDSHQFSCKIQVISCVRSILIKTRYKKGIIK